jgi:hypothetical protein
LSGNGRSGSLAFALSGRHVADKDALEGDCALLGASLDRLLVLVELGVGLGKRGTGRLGFLLDAQHIYFTWWVDPCSIKKNVFGKLGR